MLDNLPWWVSVTAALAVGIISATVVYLIVVPWQRKRIILSHSQANNGRLADIDAAADNKETTALSVISQRGQAGGETPR